MKRLPASFPLLVQAIADKHHDGYIYGITKRLRASPSLVDRWAKGLIRLPKPETVQRLAESYGLDFQQVWGLIMRDYDAYRRGEEVPIPAPAPHPGPRTSPDSVRGRRQLRRVHSISGAADGLRAATGYYVNRITERLLGWYDAWGSVGRCPTSRMWAPA